MNRTVGLLALVISLAPASGPARAQPTPLTITVETSTTARRKVRLAQEYLRRKDWADAVSLLRKILEDHSGHLVEVEPGRYLHTSSLVNRLLVDMPPAGLAVYRSQVDPLARRWFETGTAENDPAIVSRILEEAYASRFADDALWWLGQQAWQDNRPRTAARYWRQLVPRSRTPQDLNPDLNRRLGFPDSRHPEPQVRARLVLCHCLSGQLERARLEWEELKRRHPDARGTLAGKRGILVNLLADWLARPELWPRPVPDSDHATFGSTTQRNGPDTTSIDPGAPLWQTRIDNSLAATASQHTDRHPVLFNNLLFVADSFGIHAWNLETGRPAWSAGTTPQPLYPAGPPATPVRAAQPLSGPVSTSLSISAGRLYARIGSPVTAAAAREPRPLFHELVALDVASGQGRLVLKIEPGVISLDDARGGWAFDGPPLVIGDRLYVTTRRGHPQAEVGVACLDADSGTQLWHQRLAAVVTNTDHAHNVVTHNLLAASEGRLFYSGDTGVVARLDAASGSVAWISTLKPHAGTGPACSLPDDNSGLVLVTDGQQGLAALDIEQGHTAWSRQLPGGIEHLITVRDGRAIVSGHSLFALDVHSGRIAWQRRTRQQHQFGHGRGLVAGGVVYWPTRELLHLIDFDSGQPVRQPVRLDVRGCQGGNLMLSQQKLVICGGGQITVLGPFAGLLPKPRFDNSTNPAR